jgi:hypothetical protein
MQRQQPDARFIEFRTQARKTAAMRAIMLDRRHIETDRTVSVISRRPDHGENVRRREPEIG